MKRQFLEDLGLEKEAIDSIMEQNGKDIEAAKSDSKNLETKISTLETEVENLTTQVKDRDKQLETLKNSAGDVEEMKKQIETLQAENKTKDEAHANELKQVKIDSAVELALAGAKAKNIKAVKALLDLENAEIDDAGTVKGLADQIKKLQGAEDSKFLFDNTKTSIKGAKPGEAGDGAGNPGGVDTSKMTYSQLAAYMAENPDAQI